MLEKYILLPALILTIFCSACGKKSESFKILHHEKLTQVDLKPFKNYKYELKNEKFGSALDKFSKQLNINITADQRLRNKKLKVKKAGTCTFFEFIYGVGSVYHVGTFFHLNPFKIDFNFSGIHKTYATKDFLIKCYVGNTMKKDKPISASVKIISDLRSLVIKKATCRMYQGDYYMEFWAYDWYNKNHCLNLHHKFGEFDIKKNFEYEIDIEGEKQKAFVLFIDLKEFTEFSNKDFTITTSDFKIESEPMTKRQAKSFKVKFTFKDSYLNKLLSTKELNIYNKLYFKPVRTESATKEQKMVAAIVPKFKGAYLAKNRQISDRTSCILVKPLSPKESEINAYFPLDKLKDKNLQLAFVFTMAREKDPEKNKFKKTIYFKPH